LNVVPIKLPPLRERREDIPFLAEHFVQSYARQQKKSAPQIDATAMHLLMDYDWPGNVRELEHAVERMVAFCQPSGHGAPAVPGGGAITAASLPAEIRAGRKSAELVALNLPATGPLDFRGIIAQVERDIAKWALFVSNGNQVKAAEFLNLPRSTFQHIFHRRHLKPKAHRKKPEA
jgi:DNA-binding NtrC family response regulator